MMEEKQEEKKGKKLTLRWLIINLTGALFAAYAAYNVFIIVRDGRSLSPQNILISAIVALVFGGLAVFAWTSESMDIRALSIRIWAFSVAVIVIILLKLRLIGRVIDFVDYDDIRTVLYGASFLMTQIGMLILMIYYAFMLKYRAHYPRLSAFVLIVAILLFTGSLVMEAVLFFEYGIGMEANALRTVVIRPVFYLGFIGLSAYFLFPPKELPTK